MAGRGTEASPAIRLKDAEIALDTGKSDESRIEAALKVADLCMELLKISSDPQEKERLRHVCLSHLEQAEDLKKSLPPPPTDRTEERDFSPNNTMFPAPTAKHLNEPVSSRDLSTGEKIILLRGSKLHGCLFPEWSLPPGEEEFVLKEDEGKFVDPTELSLSGPQKDAFDGWRRPADLGLGSRSAGLVPKVNVTMVTKKNTDLVQDMTSDCSVVASLCVGISRAERGYPKLLGTVMSPYDHVNKRPAISPNGKYIFKMHFNGCFRRVTIDDRLPSSRTERVLHVIDRSNPGLLWPALVEKAYLKVRGGYDFPGSNSGTDLWILSGWIPEQIFLWSDDFMLSDFWKRVYKALNFGDVLVTLGTGKLSAYEEQNSMLANEHDYAVIDMKEFENGRNMFLIKNPWAEGGNWQNVVHPTNNPIDGRTTEKLRPGLFWMDSHEVAQSFKYIYLNWNPGLFSYRQNHHFTWDLQRPRSAIGSFKSNPQYSLKSKMRGTCWILLSQHFQDALPTDGKLVPKTHGFINLYAFQGRDHRTLLTERSSLRSAYVDATNVLLRTEACTKSSQVIVVSEEALPARLHNFTLSIFSTMPIEAQRAVDWYQYEIERQGAWTFSTAGGNASGSEYKINPQYSISITSVCDIALMLSTDKDDILIHVKLVHTNGERVTSIKSRDVRGDSSDYRKGSALCELRDVLPGTYAAICSTYENGQRASFSLSIKSTAPCSVKQFPPEGAGRLATKLPRVVFAQGSDRFLCPLQVSRITRIRTIACRPSLSGSVKASPLRIGLELGQGPEKEILAVSGNGDFVDGQHELGLPDVDVSPVMCQSRGIWLVVERLGGSYVYDDDFVDMKLFCDGRVEVGLWGKEV